MLPSERKRAVELAATLLMALVSGAALAGGGGGGGGGGADPKKGGKDALAQGEPFGGDGVIQTAPKDGDTSLAVRVSKNVTAMLDLRATFPVRVDRPGKRGASVEALFTSGKKVSVLGREFQVLDRDGRPVDQKRVAPVHATIVGDGFEPKDVLAVSRQKFGEKIRWFTGTVDRLQPPDAVWFKVADGSLWGITVGRDDPLLLTEVHESGELAAGALRAALAKGRPVRFEGKIATVLYVDSKGRIVEESERRRSGVRAEVLVTPSRLVLLDPAYGGYGWIEAPPAGGAAGGGGG